MRKTFTGRRVGATLVLALIVSLATACSSGESVDTSKKGSTAAVDAATKATEAARKPQPFSAPGDAVDVAAAKGKKILIIDVDSSIPVIQVANAAAKKSLAELGATVTTYDGKGQASEFARGVNQAISEKVDVVALFAIDPKVVEGPLKKAHEAGVKVMVIQYDDPTAELPDYVDAQATYCYSCAGEMMANFIVSQEKGKSVGIQLITSSDVRNSVPLVDKFTSTLKAGCPGCKIVTNDVPVANWQSDIPTQVNSTLNSNPDIKWVVPIYDGMSLFATPSIETSGRSDEVKVVSFNASQAVMKALQDKKIVAADVGSPQAWEGWAVADQFLRLMAGQEPLADTKVGLRLFDSTNIGDIDLSAPESEWYEVDFEKVYREMWGQS